MNTTTFLELERGSLEGRVVFRICLGALNRNARYPPTVLPTGFTASHPYFRTLEDCQVKVLAYTPRDLAPGLHNAWIQQSMIDHLKGDLCWVGQPVVIDYPRTYPPHLSSHQQTGSISDDASPAPTQATMGSLIDFDMNLDGPDGSGSDMTDEVIYPDESPWIVSHANLRWVIHRITRLLHRNPNRGIMMSVISLQGAYTHSAPHLDMLRRNQPWGSAERQTLTETLRFARQSQEVLVYGRIEPSNCLMAYEWTIDHYPFDMPWYFFQASAPLFRSWLGRLVWHGEMPFTLAEVRMDDRKNGRILSRGSGRWSNARSRGANQTT